MADFNSEILQIIDSVTKVKNISKEAIIHAIQAAIEAASRKKYGNENHIKAVLDRKTGEIKIFRVMKVVESITDPATEILLQEAQFIKSDVAYGEELMEQLPLVDLGRGIAQAAKPVLFQKINAAERDKEYHDFKDRVGEIIESTVKRVEFNNVSVEIGRTEGLIKSIALIKGEKFARNDRIRAYIEEVKRVDKGPQIFLSRTHKQFLVKLFEHEVPEIYDGLIKIKAVARDPGSRAKIAVYSEDNSIDAIGSCVGVRGSRVQAVINELKGEKIDIVKWSSDPATMVINALTPAEVSKVVIDEERNTIEVIVPSDNLSIAIGRRGQNVRLASHLTGWNIDVLTEEQESKRRIDEFNSVSQKFMKALDVEEMIANLLAAEGFASVEEILESSVNDLVKIEGFESELAIELQRRAANYIKGYATEKRDYLEKLGVEKVLMESFDIDLDILVQLAEAGYKTCEDVVESSVSELKKEVKGINLSDDQLQRFINRASQLKNDK